MPDQNLGMLNRRNHRGVFLIGAGVLCAVSVTLAGCSGLSKKKDSFAGISQTKQVEPERATNFAECEVAGKAAVQKLAIALATNKTQDQELLDAKNTTKRLRKDIQAADKNIADLETELAKANAQRVKTEEAQSALQQPEQLVESLRTKLDKSSKERNVLKAQIDEAQNDDAQVIEKMLAAASQEAKESKQQIEQLVALIESVETEKSELKQRYVSVQQQAARLDKAVKESRAETGRLNKQVQAALAKADSALKERTQVKQAAAKEAETLRNQLASAKQQISDTQVEAKIARIEFGKRIKKLISAAATQTDTDVNVLKNKLAIANDEIARLKAVRAEKSTSPATQQPAQPQ